MGSRLPPLLAPYLGLPPESSLVLVSGVLGSAPNWLILRYIYSILSSKTDDQDGPAADDSAIVLASFLRDHAFWKEGAARLGLDLDVLKKRNRFAFVDGLSGLFIDDSAGVPSHAQSSSTPARALLQSPTVQELRKQVNDAVAKLRAAQSTSKIVLILDQPDLLIAGTGDDVTAQSLQETVLDLREMVHSSIINLAADEPLVLSQATGLEKEHAAFSLSLTHEARTVISLRMLDTGTAKDVSGVIRFTRGGADAGSSHSTPEEGELLYLIRSDGGAQVFERGQ